jgi:hypothetical protein
MASGPGQRSQAPDSSHQHASHPSPIGCAKPDRSSAGVLVGRSPWPEEGRSRPAWKGRAMRAGRGRERPRAARQEAATKEWRNLCPQPEGYGHARAAVEEGDMGRDVKQVGSRRAAFDPANGGSPPVLAASDGLPPLAGSNAARLDQRVSPQTSGNRWDGLAIRPTRNFLSRASSSSARRRTRQGRCRAERSPELPVLAFG